MLPKDESKTEVLTMSFEATNVKSQESIIQKLKVKLRKAQKLICKNKKTILKLRPKNKKEVYDKKSKMEQFLRYNMRARFEFWLAPMKEKLVSTIMDEIPFKKIILYNSQNNKFTGFEDYGFFVSSGHVSGDRLKQIIIYVIQKLIDCVKPYITYNNKKIYFIHDCPYLLKSVRNHLKKYTFTNGHENYCWKDIEDFYFVSILYITSFKDLIF
ncbi:hypothetical protein AGLY_017350 [Aphis glycines]|uniref:Uncharacterized protein n=1 Tax=Aphis glycines TaxID=307491 RepID=A0A6G0SV66_APHGL|nr:hypothetical protein AGLY_017350 [Aphis glycines]